MYIILWIFLALAASFAALYFLFPRTLVDFAQKALRRKGGLVQKSVKVGEDVWPYLEGGPTDAEVVLLVHGFGGDKDNWAMYSPYITKKYRLDIA